VRCHEDPLVPAAPCTLAESSRGKVLAMLAESVEGGRRTYTPQYASDKARNTSPRIYMRFHPGALVPAALCVHAATLRRPPPLWGKLDCAPESLIQQSVGWDGRNKAQAQSPVGFCLQPFSSLLRAAPPSFRLCLEKFSGGPGGSSFPDVHKRDRMFII